MWCLYTLEFNSAIKKNKMLSFASKWMELENIILSGVSQVQKAKGHVFSHKWTIDQIQIQATLLKRGHAKNRSHTREGG
jgi:hypothetical protein